jgi:hypothetical protein
VYCKQSLKSLEKKCLGRRTVDQGAAHAAKTESGETDQQPDVESDDRFAAEESDESDLHATLLQAGAGDAAASNDGGCAERGRLASDQQAAAASTRSLWQRPQRVDASKAQSVAVLQAARDMLLDYQLGMSSDALPDASAISDADAELKLSAYSNSNAREFAHGANADPEAAGVADTSATPVAGGAAATQSSRQSAHSWVLAMHRAKKGAFHGPGANVYDEVEAACESSQYSCGALLMPPGHRLDGQVYCNVALTCATPVETTL